MSTPNPINAVQTRVVRDAEGRFWAQFSKDSLNWSPIGTRHFAYAQTAIASAFFFNEQSHTMPAQGDVVWRSKD